MSVFLASLVSFLKDGLSEAAANASAPKRITTTYGPSKPAYKSPATLPPKTKIPTSEPSVNNDPIRGQITGKNGSDQWCSAQFASQTPGLPQVSHF